MQKIPLNLAKPGMKLAKPVLRDNGMTIVAEGVELTETLIERLESFNIERIVVAGTPLDLGGAGQGTRYAERLARLDPLFRRFKDDKWMQQVKDFLKAYFQVKAAAQAAAEAPKAPEPPKTPAPAAGRT